MAKIRVTKDEVIKAIITEPLFLKAGYFMYSEKGKPCNVCAVGAVLRNIPSLKRHATKKEQDFTMIAEQACEYNYSSLDNLEDELDDGNYLGALSIFFENTYREEYPSPMLSNKLPASVRREYDRDLRMTLISFVEAHFPESFWVKFYL